jgi:hypothetical protein
MKTFNNKGCEVREKKRKKNTKKEDQVKSSSEILNHFTATPFRSTGV